MEGMGEEERRGGCGDVWRRERENWRRRRKKGNTDQLKERREREKRCCSLEESRGWRRCKNTVDQEKNGKVYIEPSLMASHISNSPSSYQRGPRCKSFCCHRQTATRNTTFSLAEGACFVRQPTLQQSVVSMFSPDNSSESRVLNVCLKDWQRIQTRRQC